MFGPVSFNGERLSFFFFLPPMGKILSECLVQFHSKIRSKSRMLPYSTIIRERCSSTAFFLAAWGGLFSLLMRTLEKASLENSNQSDKLTRQMEIRKAFFTPNPEIHAHSERTKKDESKQQLLLPSTTEPSRSSFLAPFGICCLFSA